MSHEPDPRETSYPESPAVSEPPKPPDPERGLRGVMSAILLFEGITLLLGLTVISHGGRSAPGWQLAVVTALAFAHILAPAVIKRRYAVAVIFALQALVIACWLIDGAIGAMGVIFTLVWIGILWMRREFRRRIAAGTIAGVAPHPGATETTTKENLP